MKNILIFVGICFLGVATGGIGFLIGIIAWIAVEQAAAPMKAEEERWKAKWGGRY